MRRKLKVGLLVIVIAMFLVPSSSYAWGKKWENLCTIESPERLAVEKSVPVEIRIDLKEHALPDTIRLWLNKKEITNMEPTQNGVKAFVSTEDGLKVKMEGDPRWPPKINTLVVKVLGENGTRDIDLRAFFVKLDEVKTVGPEGGVLEFPNGVILNIPGGAVTEETEIEVTDVQCEQVDEILTAKGFASHEIRCLGGFTGKPDGQEFLVPVTATVPVLPLEPGEIPVQLKVDLDEQKYHLAPTNFRYLSEAGLAEMEILGFSENVAGGLSTDQAAEWTVPPPQCCNQTPTPFDCCCVLAIESVSEYSGLFSSTGGPTDPTECTIAAMEVTITLPLCPGEPQQTSWVQESTQDCPEDMTCVIDVDPPVVNLFVCQEEPLSASIDCETDGTPVSFTNSGFIPFWHSDNKFAADVDPRNGKVKGVSEGIAQVEARWGVPDPRFTPDQAVVNVRSNIRSFSVTPSQETIEIGDWVVLEAEVVGADGTLLDASEVTWSSSNEDIAYASPNTGDRPLVLGVDEGTVIITAKYEYECETILTTAVITVECPQIEFTVDPAQAKIDVGDGRILTAKVVDTLTGNDLDASGVTWSSSNPNKAYLTQDTGGLTSVQGVEEGTTTITATYDDGCQTIPVPVQITVECPQIEFTVDPAQAKIDVGDGRILTAKVVDTLTGNDLDASGVTWSSSNPNKAYLTQDTGGLTSVQGVEEGTTTITATYDDGCQTIPVPVQITVECPQIEFTVDPAQAKIDVGDGRILTAKVVDTLTGNDLDASGVTWSSSNPNKAYLTQDTGGLTSVQGVEEGTTTITATYDDGCQTIPVLVQITVEQTLVVSIVPNAATISVGDNLTLNVRVTDKNGNNIPGGCPSSIDWTFPATDTISFSLATTTSATVRGEKPGVATIRAECEGSFGSAEITVLGGECPEGYDVYDEWTGSTIEIVYENSNGDEEILAEYPRCLSFPYCTGVFDLEGLDSACDANGILHVVYALEYEWGFETWYMFMDLSGWSTPERIPGIDDSSGSSLSLTFDAAGKWELVYGSWTDDTLSINYFNSSTATEVTLATHPLCLSFPNCTGVVDFEALSSVREEDGRLRIVYTLEYVGGFNTYVIYLDNDG